MGGVTASGVDLLVRLKIADNGDRGIPKNGLEKGALKWLSNLPWYGGVNPLSTDSSLTFGGVPILISG